MASIPLAPDDCIHRRKVILVGDQLGCYHCRRHLGRRPYLRPDAARRASMAMVSPWTNQGAGITTFAVSCTAIWMIISFSGCRPPSAAT